MQADEIGETRFTVGYGISYPLGKSREEEGMISGPVSVNPSDNGLRIPVVISSEICGSPELIKLFNGFRSLSEIADMSAYDREDLDDFVETNVAEEHIAWRDEWSPLHWCTRCDLPLLSPECNACGTAANWRIDLKFPCNPRPVLAHDEAMFRAVGLPWPLDASAVVNPYKRPDFWGWELVHGGVVVADVIQRHETGKFELLRARGCDPEAIEPRSVTMGDVVHANRAHLLYLEREAVAYMNSFKQRMRVVIPTLGFSGGKDSVVLAHIASMSKFRNLQVFQVDTGIEPAYNAAFSEQFLARYRKFHVHTLQSKDIFWRAIRKLGPHALDLQWCRKLLKDFAFYRSRRGLKARLLPLLARLSRPRVLILNGTRNREEPERVGLARTLGLTGSHPTMPTASVTALLPLVNFTDMDIWMYIHHRNLPINPAYTQDRNQRLVCMFCPEKNDREFEVDMNAYPETYTRLEAELKTWQSRLGFPDEWVTHGLWRYNESSSEFMQRLRIVPRVDKILAELQCAVTWDPEACEDNTLELVGRIHEEFDLDSLANWLSALGACRSRGGRIEVKIDRARILTPLGLDGESASLVVTNDGRIRLTGSKPSVLQQLASTIRDWVLIHVHCLECGGCVKQTNDVVVGRRGLSVKRRLRLETVRAIFEDCPVHPNGLRNMQRPVSAEYSPTSCTSCFVKYQRDMGIADSPGSD